jgi:hypothetical protein
VVQLKFLGHCAASVHELATQRLVAVSQTVPSDVHPVLSTQPCLQAFCAVQLHAIGSQIVLPLHVASSVHVPGSVLQTPQPCAITPGGTHEP